MNGEPFFREHGYQVAALCWRRHPALEVLLITSLRSRRWILPKGWVEPAMSPADNAAREAFEEAGITGEVAAQPAGSYHYLKAKRDGSGLPVRVEVFGLRVIRQCEEWPEKGARELAWLRPERAAALISEPGARAILRAFDGRQHLRRHSA